MIRWEPDATIQRIVESWPSAVEAPRARALGFTAPIDFDAIDGAPVDLLFVLLVPEAATERPPSIQ